MAFADMKENVCNLVQDDAVLDEIATPLLRTSEDGVLKIVLIGKTGSGKSSTGNTLLGEKKFVEDVSLQSITTYCESYKADRFGRTLRVVDTPGLFDTSMPLDKVAKEISRCMVMLSPGPHAFLFVLKVGRFTEEEQNTVTHLLDIFGEGALNYIIIVITHKAELDRKNKSLEQYLNADTKLKKLTNMCPTFAIDNAYGNEEQVKDLITLVEHTVERNGNTHYTNEMLKHASKAFERKKQQLEEEEQRKFEEKVKPIKEKFENEQILMNQQLCELENDRIDLQGKVESGQEELQQVLNEKTQQMEAFRIDIENANRAHADRLKDIESEKNNAIREIELKLDHEKNVIAKLDEVYKNQMESLRIELERQRKQLQEESDAKLEKIMTAYRADNETERQRRDQEMALMRQAHKEELERLQKASDGSLDAINQQVLQLRQDNQRLADKIDNLDGDDGCHIL